MAEEEAQAQEQEGGEQEQSTQAAAQPPAGGSKLLPIIIIIILLSGIAGGVAYYFLIHSSDEPSVEAATAEEAKFIESYQKRSQPSIESIKVTGEPVFSPVFSYSVNMSDRRHMMQISFRAKMYDEKALAYLLKYRPVIDNNMMDLLGRWKAEDLRNRSGLELLKQAIYRELNGHFEQDFIELSESRDRMPVKDILISEYYIN